MIQGPEFGKVTSRITPAGQVNLDSSRGGDLAGSSFTFGNEKMSSYSVSSVVPSFNEFKLKKLEVWYLN